FVLSILYHLHFFSLLIRPPPRSSLFPYTTLFRSLDIFKTHFINDTDVLYHNDGKGNFDDRTLAARLGVETRFASWGTGICDLDRSEEHTSELQSQSNLVCRLLLEKKKKKKKNVK